MVIRVKQMEEIMTLLLSAPYAPFLVITLIISNKKSQKRFIHPIGSLSSFSVNLASQHIDFSALLSNSTLLLFTKSDLSTVSD